MTSRLARCLCGPRRTTPSSFRVTAYDAKRSARKDPTGTGPIRSKWTRNLDQRWRAVTRMVPGALSQHPATMISHSLATGAANPVDLFGQWLTEALRQVVLGGDGTWLLSYVRSSTDLGQSHAQRSVGGTEGSSPVTDRTHLLQTLAITELQGIVDAVAQQASRAYAQGLLNKQTATQIAGSVRQVIEKTGVQRGHAMISFMAVKSFNAATLDGFRARGIKRVGIRPEARRVPPVTGIKDADLRGMVNVMTAEDELVCPECEEIAADGPYYIDEAESLIPAHPNCRCAFEPADEDEAEDFLDSATHIASGVMISADNTGRVLFVRRSGTGDQAGTWAFPGGAVEPGETVHQAAARETREEIGYDPGDDLEEHHRDQTNGVDFTTYAHSADTEFRPRLNEEHDAYAWRYVNNPPSPLHPGVVATLQAQGREIADDYNENEPRDETGKWTVGGGGGGAPPPEHPLQKHLSSVQGTSNERVAMRAAMKVATHSESKVLQEKHNASFWKQHQMLTKQGKHDKAAAVADKLDKYSKSYGISNPLKSAPAPSQTPTPAKPVFGKAKPKFDINTPEGNFAHSLNAIGVPASIHPGDKTAVVSAPSDHADKMAQVAKYHPQMQLMPGMSATYGVKGSLASTEKPPHDAFANALKKEGIFSNTTPHPDGTVHISTSTIHASKMAEMAKDHPQWSLIPGKKSTYQASQSSFSTAVKSEFDNPASPHYVPPNMVPQEPLDFKSLSKVGDQKGSNPGGVYHDPSTGNQYYIKSMDEAHAKNELLAAKLYALAGSKTLDYVPVKPDGDVHYVATKFEKLDKDNVSKLNSYEKDTAQDNFAVHAWLANWDAAGTGGDNQGVKNGVVKTLDVGGALDFRAKGTPKGEAFGDKVTEFDTMRSGPKNPDAVQLFGSMTNDQIKKSVIKIDPSLSFDKNEIQKTVASVYGEGTPKTKELTDKLAARQADIVKRADALGKAPPADDLSHMSDEEQRMHWLGKTLKTTNNQNLQYHMGTNELSDKKKNKLAEMGVTPAETGFIRAFTGPSSGVNASLRDGHMDEHAFAFKHIMNEALDKFPAYDGDRVYRKIQLTAEQQDKYVPGKIVHWQAFSSTSKHENTWSGNTHFTIEKPKSGRDVQFISENPGEAEVIMPADTYYRVLSNTNGYGGRKISLEEVIPFGKKKKQKVA